jgi:hypothetical protein
MVQGLIQGALNIIAPMTSRQRYQQSTGRDRLRCPHCHRDMGGAYLAPNLWRAP